MKNPCNGHESRAAWNVSLWLSNDEPLYRLAQEAKRRNASLDAAARWLLEMLGGEGARTPDGVRYSVRTIRLALRDL